ncbi:Hpt domain-containing protein [Roseospira marina]|uniref:Hpt domain-containing protein n=1 Tax=Roseospira marina TaxID=140057 RepID=A0A5M6IHB7_9PROT|nr:Hpt domain-containing protein [Roseospira marina]KAA5606948.1 Hpt domain-containing protein [Roseospira marina]MBB4312877.1 chemotaxis protein histidine kinase CheA [Roseospira marina]MBB5086350.1 chemotaxis protein histidine kinase CheA [Roseospira marina]
MARNSGNPSAEGPTQGPIQGPGAAAESTPPTEGGLPAGVDRSAVEKAEALIASLHDDYVTWAREDVAALGLAVRRLEADPPNPAVAKADVFRIAHDLKGQGGSFGYDLITQVGNALCRFLEAIGDPPTPAQLAVIRLHVEAIQTVLDRQMQGDGGAAGADMVDGLNREIATVLE